MAAIPHQDHYFLTAFVVKIPCIAACSIGWAIMGGFASAQITFMALEILRSSGNCPESLLLPGGNDPLFLTRMVALFAAGAGGLYGARVGNQVANYILSHKPFKRDA